jgi:hypothetical protein
MQAQGNQGEVPARIKVLYIKATNSESLRLMFYFSIIYQQNVSDSNLDHITHSTLSDSPTKVPFLNYDVEQRIESP